MKVQQLSVFLENKTGRLAEATRALAVNNINIRALSLADTTDFGVLRLIVNDSENAYEALKKEGFVVRITEVIGVQISDRPGGLDEVLTLMKEEGINIEYLYAFLGTNEEYAVVILRVEEMDRAVDILEKQNIKTLDPSEL